MASLIHFMIEDPNWVLPDRKHIPHDVPFFQKLSPLMRRFAQARRDADRWKTRALSQPHRRGVNERALKGAEAGQEDEADCLMDGAWTGHQIE